MVQQLLSHEPEQRPNAGDILSHALLLPVQDSRTLTRTRSNSRNRTISTASMGTASNSGDEQTSQ